jgi:hypothetical protein
MTTTAEFIAQIPQPYSRGAVATWVGLVLAQVPADQVAVTEAPPREPEKVQVHLPAIEAEMYRQLIARFGTNSSLKDATGQLTDDPNIPLLFLWGLNDKYGLGLRLETMVSRDGILQYDVRQHR